VGKPFDRVSTQTRIDKPPPPFTYPGWAYDEVCDGMEVIFEIKIGAGEFDTIQWRDPGEEWESFGGGYMGTFGDYKRYSANWQTPSMPHQNVTKQFRGKAKKMVWPPPHLEYFYSAVREWTTDNTVVTSPDKVLLFDGEAPDPEDPPAALNIPWNIDHMDYETPTFDVTVTVYNLSGGSVREEELEDVGLGDDSWDWDGKNNQCRGRDLYLQRASRSRPTR